MSTAPVPASDVKSPRDGSGEMFDAIAPRYDLLNRLISLGVDQGWRTKTVQALALPRGARVLDLATGTADLALLIAKTHPDARIDGVDPSVKMLEIGKAKAIAAGAGEQVSLSVGTAEKLDFPDGTFNGLSIAFGIRNVTDRPRALREMARVTKPGGRIAILELSEPKGGFLAPFARFHVHQVVPFVGGLLSGSHEYKYLQRSIAAFPPAEEFVKLMGQSGLRVIEARPLTFGVCHLYVAEPSPPA